MSSLAAAALMASAQLSAPAPGQSGGPQRVAPRGGYAQTCSGAYVNQGRLYADCRDRRGEIRGTSIQLNQCGDYEIQNTDGRLTCGRFQGDYEGGRPGNGQGHGGGWGNGPGNGGGWNPGNGNGPGRPGGGWGNGGWGNGGWGNGGRGRDRIVVYRDSQFRGESRELRGEVADLNREGFNDAISSMRFVGTWEACTDAYFRGYCQTFTDSVSNLASYGVNDRISSIRPVRRGW
ncbi:hypothetical protein ASG17_07240 [Brevundimonas sp. Leaf363]|nr:hypothetical protein ASG17_07240 [Brevundimonas sp. Leaf363]